MLINLAVCLHRLRTGSCLLYGHIGGALAAAAAALLHSMYRKQ